tara:strand:+ start:115 stop:507 length:393 start_codon:yes stop_codon:yes gene_type:complete
MSGPFKMAGYTYPGESPAKTINLSKVASKIKSSKFGGTKLGEVVGNVTEKAGNVQEKFIAGKKKLGLSTSGYDDTIEGSDDDVMIVEGKGAPSSEAAQNNASSSIEDTLPKTPMAKRAPTRNYKKGYYKK